MSEGTLYQWEAFFNDWFLLITAVFLGFELVRYVVIKKFSWALAGDAVTNFVTQAMYLVLSFFIYGAFYIAAFFYFYQFALFDIQISWATVLIAIVLADLVYYWEHRFMHRVGIAWATHTVHHSSPHFNISVAYRFGPMDAFWPVFFHVPLVLLGFNPFVVFFAEIFVQFYQILLHTEAIGKLPKPIEKVFNTPSHHRVHHGSNKEYHDKNYGGIFIIWDRLFGTFEEEKAKVNYGITQPVNSINPLTVFFHGFTRLWTQLKTARGIKSKLMLLLNPPGWSPNMVSPREISR
ncbi:MAG: sterol desaturase family protein [Pseudomonadota bacterium]